MLLLSRLGSFLQSHFSTRTDLSAAGAAFARGRNRRDRSKHARLFDFLEQRQLLSSLIVSGNGNTITNGSITPTSDNFTNFMSASTTNNSALGLSTRIFSITNTTSAEIDLTGGANLVQITGADAGDFTLTSLPTATLAPGATTSFTVQYLPLNAGARNAVITIPNNSADEPAFTFAIEGVGLTTTNASSNLEVATDLNGTGKVAAVNGDVLQVTYTGYLLNGTIFDSTAKDGGTPFTFRLDDTGDGPGQGYFAGNTSVDSPVIGGWEQGLQGIKNGETRTLIIPSALAYGTTGSTAANGTVIIPPNSTLVFDISVNDLAYSPELGIEGNNALIPAGDTTPSTTDGTDFGTLPAGQKSVTHTFNLFDFSEADDATGAPIDGLQVTGGDVTGTGAKNFTLVGGANGTFTVTYTPTTIGATSAVINLISNDAGNPDYTFTVTGTDAAAPDLTISTGKTKFPASIVSGAGTKLSLPLTITNDGNTPLAKNAVAQVQIFLQNTANGTQTLLTAPITSVSVSNLAAGKSKTLTETLTIPASVVAGTYELVAVVNANAAVSETNTANDSAATTQTFTLAAGFYDLTGALVSSKLPTTVVANQPVKGSLSLSIQNAGNIVLPKGQGVTVTVIAHNLTTNTDNILLTTHESLSAFKAGLAHTFNVPINDAAGLATGTYQYEATIAPSPALAESNTDNNDLLTTAGGTAFEVTVNPAVNNLTGTLSKSTLKSGAAALAGAVAVKIQSTGNVNLPADQLFTLQIFAHPAGAIDNSTDVLLQTSAAFSLKNWKPNQSATFTVPVNTTLLATGSYAIEAKIVPTPDLAESSTADNLITETAAGQLITLGIA
jgi:FKBP-type peptidyl-prolyl cis-trans isomerase